MNHLQLKEMKKTNTKTPGIEVLSDTPSSDMATTKQVTHRSKEEEVKSQVPREDGLSSAKSNPENNSKQKPCPSTKKNVMEQNPVQSLQASISVPDDAELELALKELCDPLVPVRGHGLIRLTHMVQERGKALEPMFDTLLKIFEENLDHTDTYIYLSAVNGLSALCEVFPEASVSRVCELFSDLGKSQGQGSGLQRSPELRMKLGEILVKASRSLGN